MTKEEQTAIASTGPRAFTRGSDNATPPKFLLRALQRGRALSRADRNAPGWVCSPMRSFNGAARFHARIGPERLIAGVRDPLASTGPRAFTRGSTNLYEAGQNYSLASTGPRAFTRGSTTH